VITFVASLAGCSAHRPADARITRIENHRDGTPTFGGLLMAGRRQYEKISARLSASVNRTIARSRDRRHRARAAQRARQRRVLLQLLHPEADRPQEGRGQNDVRAAQPRRQDLAALGGHGRPWAATRRSRLGDHESDRVANSFLMPRGYTHGVERVGDLGTRHLQSVGQLPIAKVRRPCERPEPLPARLTNHTWWGTRLRRSR